MSLKICNYCGSVLKPLGDGWCCPVCGVLLVGTSEEEASLIREAFQKLRLYEFDEAKKSFAEMILRYPKNPDGYWGRLLSKHEIKYVWDPNGQRLPTCATSSEKSITEDEDYEKALALASEETRAYYRAQAARIDGIRLDVAGTIETADLDASGSDIPSKSPPCEENTPRKGKRNKKKIFAILCALLVLLIPTAIVLPMVLGREKPCVHEEILLEGIASTCTEDGQTESAYCGLCGEMLRPCVPLPALGHTPGKDATCTESQACTVCEAVLVPAPGHRPGAEATCFSGQLCLTCNEELVPAAHTPGPSATCMQAQSCTVCGTVLDAGGHREAMPATCYSGSYCVFCGEQMSDQLDHVPGPPATCTSGQFCTLCDAELESDMGHEPSGEASCLESSYCLTCAEILEEPRGHSVSEFTSCTEGQMCLTCNTVIAAPRNHLAGDIANCENAQICLVCNLELNPALGHRVAVWEVDCEPTFGVKGSRSGTCLVCSETAREDIPALFSPGLAYALNDDGTYSVVGVGTCTDTWIVIPDVFEDIPVTAIAENAFYNCSQITEISIPVGVTSIGARAFYLCRNLREAVLPEGITSLGEAVFSGCTSMTSAALPSTLASIGNNAFSGCVSLTGIDVPKGVTAIGSSVFFGCKNLESVTLPNGLLSIGSHAFYQCGKLKEIVLPDSVTSIGDHAFYFCVSLAKVSSPKDLKYIGDYAFYRCTALSELVLPNGLTNIGSYAFSLCDGLYGITVSEGLSSVGDGAFASCRNLKTVVFVGTAEQWERIRLGVDWCADVPARGVACADGNVAFE